ncbi:MAG: YcxB family protein [Desulfobacterales bacterium]|nr:YcxB family protein [Desulfobacterales bacterium]
MKAITLTYSEDLIKETVRAYWWKKIGFLFIFALLVLTAFLTYLLLRGDRSWLVGAIGCIVVLGVAVIVGSYLVYLRHAKLRFERMEKPEATLEIENDSFTISSDFGASTIKWSTIAEVQQTSNAWLVYFSETETMTLPLKTIPPDAKRFLRTQFKKHHIRLTK